MNDTERSYERYLAFSDTHGSIHPSTRQRRYYYCARTLVLLFLSWNKNYFDFRAGRIPRHQPRRATKFIIAGINERTLSHSRRTFISRLMRVIAICLRKFDMVVIGSQEK